MTNREEVVTLDLDKLWADSKKYMIDGIEEFTKDWQPNGQAQHVKDRILSFMRRMPTPRPNGQNRRSE